MNIKQEKILWLISMLASYALALWVLLGAINGSHSAFYLIGIILICYFTTKCYNSCNEYN